MKNPKSKIQNPKSKIPTPSALNGLVWSKRSFTLYEVNNYYSVAGRSSTLHFEANCHENTEIYKKNTKKKQKK